MRASEFVVEYKLSVSKDSDGIAIKATAGGKQLGHAEFFFNDEGHLDPQTVWVDERYHGQGIARDMYDHLKDLGYTIVRSWDQTDAGRGFWNKHRGEDERVWEGLPPMGFNKNPNKHDPIKNPLRTFVEIANMLGITHKQLVGLQRNYPGFPDPFPGIGKQIGRGRNNYYALNQVKQWINNNNINEKIKAWNDNTPAIDENFADGKVKGKSRPGRVKRAGASCSGSVTDLRKRAKNSSGEKAKMYHWCANMKAGKKKTK